MRMLHSQILAKQGCRSWGWKSLERVPRWDIARGTCVLLEEERGPLDAVDQHAMASHAILGALDHISRALQN